MKYLFNENFIMKAILVLTDFSANAENSAKTAVYLASKLKTNLFLFNTCVDVPVMTAYGGGPWIVDEILERRNQGTNKLKLLKTRLADTIARCDHHDYHPTIHTECGEGGLGINVEEIISERDVEMVIMGASITKPISHLLTGDAVTKVINHANRPILIIPQHVELQNIKNVMFATDFNEEDHAALSYLSQIGLKLQFHVELVHINLYNEKPIVPFEKKIFMDEVFSAGYSNVSFKEMNGKELPGKLAAFCEQQNIDMLAMMHHQQPFFMRLFQHSTTSQILSRQNIPLFVFPSGMPGKR